ncbi:MAG: tetratricopeptide repeat protein [Phocaeicola sp.]|uniref:tetratricopeptide repeat protein n=1 Tax=Phocaeicola TaxID=909656 RepID=UPI00234E7FFE|nr:tetratricopeptide repeat protein [Phocaeicola oris]MCE2617420.1 tetratricopeptide repeat protein [Phocaeicola oris]
MKRIGSFIFLLAMCAVLNAQTYKDYIDEAVAATNADSLSRAEQMYKKALETDPTNSLNTMLFANLGTIQRRQGKTDAAIDSYSLALNRMPLSIPILLNRASLYLEKNLYGKALVDYCNVLDIDKKNEEALIYRAYIYVEQRKYKEARTDYATLLQKDPENKLGRLGLADLDEKEGRLHEALEIYNRFIEENPRDVSFLKARANLEMEMDSPALALQDMETALKINNADADIYLLIGDIRMKMKNRKDAYASYERAIKLGVPRPQIKERIKQFK